jgi:hypothetical protein
MAGGRRCGKAGKCGISGESGHPPMGWPAVHGNGRGNRCNGKQAK